MTIAFIDTFITQSQNTLQALTAIVDKAEKHADSSSLPTSRLAPDMKSFSFQIFSVTTQIQFVLARLTDSPYPEANVQSDKTYTYDEMRSRIKATVEKLAGADKSYILAHCEEVKPTNMGTLEITMSGEQFAAISQANIFFHCVTAYNILRNKGVGIGKADYILHFIPKEMMG